MKQTIGMLMQLAALSILPAIIVYQLYFGFPLIVMPISLLCGLEQSTSLFSQPSVEALRLLGAERRAVDGVSGGEQEFLDRIGIHSLAFIREASGKKVVFCLQGADRNATEIENARKALELLHHRRLRLSPTVVELDPPQIQVPTECAAGQCLR